MSTKWVPKSILALKGYTRRDFVSDLIAGVTVGLVALPLAMAFAIASGVPPQAGLYTAIIAGFLISALGGSRVQIGGPTGAFVVVVAGIVAKYGIDGLFMCTGIAGVMLIFLGATGLGSAVKYIPRPVVVGFTNGIAIVIASTQLKDFFGLKIEHVPGNFLGRLEVVVQNFRTISWQETGLAVLALALILAFRKYVPKVPGYIVALFVGTALVRIFHLPVETIGTRFGGIPAGLPALKIPQFHFDLIRPLISPALTVAMLGAIESLMSAVVADRLVGHGEKAQAQRGADRTGRGQLCFAADGWLAGDGRDCAHSDEHSIRRKEPSGRHDPRAYAAGDSPVRRSAGQVYSAGGIGGDSARGLLQHGRVVRDSGAAEALAAGGGVLVGDVRADRVRRSHSCR